MYKSNKDTGGGDITVLRYSYSDYKKNYLSN